VDVVIEGKITPEEGMSEIVQMVVDLKTVSNPVLRVSSAGSLEGKIGFGRGGTFIIGGKVTASDETGYPAVRKLLAIKEGTFAILDPGRTQLADVNQTLWLKSQKVLQFLPNLPESPEIFLDGGDLERVNLNVEKAQLDPMDLKAAVHHGKDDVVKSSDSKARKHMDHREETAKWFLIMGGALVLAAVITQYWDNIVALLPH
jgi:hypothetical protein